jgi:hypothetical protein
MHLGKVFIGMFFALFLTAAVLMVAFGCFLPVGEDWVFLETLGDVAFFSLVIGVAIEIVFFAFRNRHGSEGNVDVAEVHGVRRILSSLRGTPLIYIGIIMALGLLSQTWFRGYSLVAGIETELPVDPKYNLYIVSYVWTGIFSRESAQTVCWLIPQASFFALMDLLGFSIAVSERVFFYILFTMSGIFMFLMSSMLLKGKGRYLAGFVSALFYMMNFYPMMFRWRGCAQDLPPYIVTPLIFLFLAKGIEQKSGGWSKYVWAIAFTTLLSASNMGNPGYNISVWMIMVLYVLFSLLTSRNFATVKHIFKFFGVVLIVFVALNAWWFLPTLMITPARLPSIYELGIEGERTMTFVYTDTKYANLLSALRQLSHWSFFSGHRGTPYFLYSYVYEERLFIALSFLAPVLAFLSLFLVKNHREHKYVLFFAGLSLVGGFLVKGIHSPFGEIFQWFFINVPYPTRIFRMPHDKLGNWMAFGYAFLIGYSVAMIYYKLASSNVKWRLTHFFFKKITKSFTVGVILFLLFGVYMFPYWTGDLLMGPSALSPGVRIESIPRYYYEAGEWFNSQSEDFKIFTLPFRRYTGSAGLTYTWGYDGGDPTKHIVHKPFIQHAIEPPPIPLTNEIYDMFHDNASQEIGRYLGIMNVKYLLLHNDFDYTYYAQNPDNVDPPGMIADLLKSQDGIRLVKSFGELAAYENDYYVPHVYTSSNIVYTNNFSARMWGIGWRYSPYGEPPVIFSEETSYLFKSFSSEVERPNFMQFNLSSFGDLTLLQMAADGFVNNNGWEVLKLKTGRELGASMTAVVSYRVFIPESGNYTLHAYVRWDERRADLQYRIDEGPWSERVSPFKDVPLSEHSYGFLELGPSYVSQGNHTITFLSTPVGSRNYQNINYFVLSSSAGSKGGVQASVMSERLSPVEYKVHVNASAPFLMVFSEAYHPLWKAYYGSELGWLNSMWTKPISDQNHFLVNEYMNAWYIDRTGEYDIILYFQGQNYFYVGAIISIVTFTTGVAMLVLKKHKKRSPYITSR